MKGANLRRLSVRRLAVVLSACGLLAACSDTWLGDTAEPPLPGKRISVLMQSKSLEPDAGASNEEILLPPPETVADWPQAGGYPPHAMYHLSVGERLREVWRSSIGTGGSKRQAFLSPPVVFDGRVYAMDAESMISAYDLRNGRRLWKRDTAPDDADKGSFGGGLAVDDGKLFATTSYGQLLALDLQKGKVIWTQNLPAPVRGAPTARAGRVLVITVDNQTLALSQEDGHQLWSHQGINEAAALVGSVSPAVDGNTVVVPYTSGEVYALRIENGAAIWSDVLTTMKRTDQVATLNDIRGLPVIDRGRVYAVSNSDTFASIDLRSGRRMWDREIGSTQTPWVAGDFVYLLTNSSEVVCFDAKRGKIRWVSPLQQWRNEEEKRGRIVWTGPVLASDRLIVASSEGDAMAVSPYTGEVLGHIELPDGILIAPIIANDTLLFMTNDGDLVAYR